MGALAPVSSWLPEDDLLLKNSIEAGASLESLAKGAVQFSRKFSVQELQNRWHSLLYDPVISAEASFRMMEFERSAVNLPSKFSRAGNSKENKSLSGKRKAESVRSCYYALRKRIHNEPFNSMDLSFLVAPGDNSFFENGDEPLSENCILGDPMSNHFGLQESHLGIMHHSFPPILEDCGTSRRDGHVPLGYRGHDHPVEDDFSMQQDDIHKEIPHIFEENEPYTGNGCGVEDLGQAKQVPGVFETDNLEANPQSAYGQMNSGPGNVCSDFDGNQVFHSPIPECGASFSNLEYSSPSPLPEMPIWRTVEDISSQSIPVDDSHIEKDLHTGDTFALTDDGDAKDTSTPGCNLVHANSELKMQMPCDELKCPASGAEGYLAELTNSLLNFNDEELMTLDDDGKGMIDKAFLDGLNLLLNSPIDVNRDHVPSPELRTSVTPDYVTNASSSCPVESVENVQMQSSASASDLQFPELIDGIICCVLNTEDQEIPCNDDVVFPSKLPPLSVSAVARRNLKEAGNSICSSVKNFAGNKKLTEGPVLMQREQENPALSQVSSQIMGSQVIPEKGQLHPVGDCGVKFGIPNRDSPHLASGKPAIYCGSSNHISSMNIHTDSHRDARLKEENKDVASAKNIGHTLTDSFMEKTAFGSDGYKRHERNAIGVKQEFDDPATIQDCRASKPQLGSTNIPDSEPDINHPIPEPEEPPIESDDDVPYYSDIEAMILDMDLDPDDQDIYEQEVSKYQHEDTRRALIRLEQGAHCYMQRTIASHGAFAILYGRHSKHYIKKPEVLLGRATEDIVVDIDLGREGRANKVSRRQAIINMDKSGSFHLKNLGKSSISVNNKEVAHGQSLSLISSCLIEIRGMPFVFETNQTCVKHYVDSIAMKNQNQEHEI